MKLPLILAVVAFSATSHAQTHSALLIDTRDGTVTPTIGTTLKAFEPLTLGKVELWPEAWGMGSYDIPTKRFALGLAGVLGYKVSEKVEVFAGLAGQWTTDNRFKVAPVVGFDFKF